MKKVFVSLSFVLFLAFTSQAQTQPGSDSSGNEQQYGEEWNADQQYGDEWNADQQYGPEWDPEQQYGDEWNPDQPNKGLFDYLEEGLFGKRRNK